MPTITIPNITIEPININGSTLAYKVIPDTGYVLHDKRADVTNDDGTVTRYFSTGYKTVNSAYDFTVTTEIDGYTAYGEYEFFAVPSSAVPSDQIYGLKPETETI